MNGAHKGGTWSSLLALPDEWKIWMKCLRLSSADQAL